MKLHVFCEFGMNTATHENINGQSHYLVGKNRHPSNYQCELDNGSCETSLIADRLVKPQMCRTMGIMGASPAGTE
jgi:hypothetical protein